MKHDNETEESDSDDVQESRCIGVCVLDEDGDYCTACGQTISELMK